VVTVAKAQLENDIAVP